MKRIVLTGGGTAGHVTPNIALLPSLKEAGYEVFYIGSYTGIEKQLIEDLEIPYYGISSGKLRRYKSLKKPFRPVPRSQRVFSGKDADAQNQAGYRLFQGRFCIRAGCFSGRT